MVSEQEIHDIFIIGGGINGAGIARDAAGRGLSVILAEMNDLASGTSSNSSKLIHGGLRYLEYYEFRLVREALKEREVLWKIAPHIIWPVRIVLPYNKDLRPFWLLRIGLFLYDYIGGRKKLPATTTINLNKNKTGKPLKPGFDKAFEYSDCAVLDSRLVILNAMDARDRSAKILTRTRVIKASRKDGLWEIQTQNTTTRKIISHRAKIVINAAGPWIDQVLEENFGRKAPKNIRLVQGSHIIVKKIYGHDKDYIFQNADGRIIFIVPYEEDFTMIGTTDHDHDGQASDAKIAKSEIEYLCNAASEYFQEPIVPDDVIGTFCGVRPLYDDGASKAQEATRDYVLKLEGGSDSENNNAALINIFGGKLTTYRRLAESVLKLVESELQLTNAPWTADQPLPGGDFAMDDFSELVDRLQNRFPFVSSRHARRLIRCYGTRAFEVLDSVKSPEDLGRHFGATLYECEVRYLVNNEWAQNAEDILIRRTKQGLHLTRQEHSILAKFLKSLK
ncbi:MAG: glycerol-3-phosphate dehydrogenase [Rhizobiaceae bacterium]|nr:glycerol-3-phosphate dehydrogenase [Rhizobiaceae bacterium]